MRRAGRYLRPLAAYLLYYLGCASQVVLLWEPVVANGGYRLWNAIMCLSADVQGESDRGPWRRTTPDDAAA